MQQSEIVRERAAPGRLQLIGALPTIISTMSRLSPDEPRYVKPPRSYELPEYRKDMQYCRSKEPYLRPVRWCNPLDHHVVARAHALGAYELSDREYAEAAYWWMKTNMWWEMDGWYDAGETLLRGKGTCNHLNNAYVALCRCAGIRARILNFNVQFGGLAQGFLARDSIMSSFMNNSGGVIPETEAEVLIDGAWTPAYIPQNILLTAVTGWPISEFGESCLSLYYDIVPGSLHHVEGISFKSVMMHRLLSKFAPATQERLNVKFQETQTLGRTVLDIQGGVEGYNRITRPRVGSISKEEVLTLWKNQRLKPQ